MFARYLRVFFAVLCYSFLSVNMEREDLDNSRAVRVDQQPGSCGLADKIYSRLMNGTRHIQTASAFPSSLATRRNKVTINNRNQTVGNQQIVASAAADGRRVLIIDCYQCSPHCNATNISCLIAVHQVDSCNRSAATYNKCHVPS